MVVYFSGTGNSRRAAQVLAHALSDELLDAFGFIRDGIAADLVSTASWVFVCPTYAWQIPHIFRDFILSGSFAGCRDAYFVMTCGSEAGNAEKEIRALCGQKGFAFRGLLEVIMPENYIAMFSAPDAAEAAPIIERADRRILEAAPCILAGKDFPERKTAALDALKSGPVNRLFYRLFVKADSFIVSGSCIGCGKCMRSCVTANIAPDATGKPIWGDRCTHCMACICGCPVGAIEYGRKSKGQPRYQCPPYEPEG